MTINRVAKFSLWRRGNKYGAQRTTCNQNHSHRSKLEARTCDELEFRRLAGDIDSYEKEVRIKIFADPPHNTIFLWNYYLDFLVTKPGGQKEAVEAKGLRLGNWKKTWALLQKMHPEWEFTEVRR